MMNQIYKKSMFVVIFCLMAFGVVNAQTKAIKGKVTSADDGHPLVGATVKANNAATQTNNNGEFTLNAPANASTVTVSNVGFETQTVKISDNLSIALKPTGSDLNEVVVIGYGVTKKKDLTGSVSTVNKKAIENIPITRVDQMLQGQASGVQVTSTSGAPGSATTIRIRGGNSINAGNEPLYVIDGLIGGGNLNLINPQDIASITVLKDASSTAIYGARGANGVILVTTKQGTQGRDNITFDAYYGLQKIPKFISVLNATQYGQLVNDEAAALSLPIPFADPTTLGVGTNWQKEITRVAPIQSYTLGANGGAHGYTYFISGNYTQQMGIIKNSGLDRYQFRTNINKQVKDNLKVGVVLNIGHSFNKNSTATLGGTGASSAIAYDPTQAIYKADGTFTQNQTGSGLLFDNPVVQTLLPINNTTVTNIIGNTFAEWELIKGLTLKSTFGSEFSFQKDAIYNPSTLPSLVSAGTGGNASLADTYNMMWLNENTLSYIKTFGDHSISAVIGTSIQKTKYDYMKANGSHYYTDALSYNNLAATQQVNYRISSDANESAILSYLARVNYTYKDKYLITLSGRQDASSRFAANHKQALFGAVALAWNAYNEDFIKNLNVFSNLKLRASYGTNGNQGIDTYQSLAALSSVNTYIIGGAQILGYTSNRIANPNLRWETTGQLDLGLEMGFLKGKINVELDYYDKVTKNLLLSKALPTQTGYTSTLFNAGSIGNKGLELTISTTNIEKPNFSWTSTFNIAGNRNKTIDLGGVNFIDTYKADLGTYRTVSRLVVGQPVGIFWGATYMGVQKTATAPTGTVSTTGVIGSPLYKDLDGDGKISDADYGVIGNSNPKLYGGVGNTFTYKKLSLNVFFQGSYGNQVMNVADAVYNVGANNYNQYATWVNRYTATNTDTNIPKVNSQDYIYNSSMVYNASFLRLKSVTLSYALSGKDLGLKWVNRMNVYVSGTNLALWTKYPFYDPEVSGFGTDRANTTLRGFDSINYPQNRTFVLGVNITL